MTNETTEIVRRTLPTNAWGIVYLRDSLQTAGGRWTTSIAGYLELVQQEEFGITKLSDSSWGMMVRNKNGDHQIYILGCQIRAVEVCIERPRLMDTVYILG
jgi:hypothetical protein